MTLSDTYSYISFRLKLFILLSIFSAFFTNSFYAQVQFEEILVLTPPNTHDFIEVYNSSIASADVDGDGDVDVMIIGNDLSGNRVANLHLNDGNANFQLMPNTPFEAVNKGHIVFADIDSDSDLDLLITGTNSAENPTSRMYLNDGQGQFTYSSDLVLTAVKSGFVAFSDIDSDSDLDLLLTGLDSANVPVTKLYKNIGDGQFQIVLETPFQGVYESGVDFADVDGDNDQDVIIMGRMAGGGFTRVYFNDGLGNFALSSNYFGSLASGAVVFTDFDNDGDQDVLVSGKNGPNGIGQGYRNDGLGQFSLVYGTGLYGLSNSSISIIDFDNDGDNDLVISGMYDGFYARTYLLVNDGLGTFSQFKSFLGVGGGAGSVLFSDLDSDSDYDLIMTGNGTARIYLNENGLDFSEIQTCAIDRFYLPYFVFLDVDSDFDKDLVIVGDDRAELYKNDGNGNYSKEDNSSFIGVSQGKVAFADIDGDLDLDLCIIGDPENPSNFSASTNLYLNEGEGIYVPVVDHGIVDVWEGDIAFADIDGDLDMDLLIAGQTNYLDYTTRLYRNDGFGNYTQEYDVPFPVLSYTAFAFIDVDGDEDPDLLRTGSGIDLQTNLYINDGMGHFTLRENPFQPVFFASINHSDVDNDGDQDVLILGITYDSELSVNLYLNDGDGNFNFDINLLSTSTWIKAAFGDVDTDGDIDIVASGYSFNAGSLVSELFLNDGSGLFALHEPNPFGSVSQGHMSFADINNDVGDDFLIVGSNYEFRRDAILYKNLQQYPLSKKESIASDIRVSLFPNPALDKLTITLQLVERQFIDVSLFDSCGRNLGTYFAGSVGSGNAENLSFDISNIPSGSYLVQITAEKFLKSIHFIHLGL